MNKVYDSIIISKTGSPIPVFSSGRTIESRYNPEQDAERILNTINLEKNFFIVLGLGSGIFINKLLEKKENSFILAIENSEEDINFLKEIKSVQALINNNRFQVCTLEKIKEVFPKFYIPAFYGDIEIIEQRAWILENQNQIEKIKEEIQAALSIIVADYSVQSHFGKIWQSNVRKNLKILTKNKFSSKKDFPIEKKALIIAAGPSLDKKIEYLKKEKQNSFIISTDTAFSTLLANSIKPDFVISIDGQHVSQTHFIHNGDYSGINFIFDLTANPNAVNHVKNKGGNIYFSRNEHPLSRLACNFANYKVLNLCTGSGTVTIAALDFAIKLGFKEIEVLAADFSYPDNKAYAKGTYLDSNFSIESSRLAPLEKKFCNLLLRTERIKISENNYTSQILNAYKDSFEAYLTNLNLKFKKSDDLYKIINTGSRQIKEIECGTFNIQEFYNFIKSDIDFKEKTFFELSQTELSLLPAVAYFRRKDKKRKNISEFLKLAYSSLVGYNI